jgi:hypothetical protein
MQKLHEALSCEEQGKRKSLQHQLDIKKLEDRIVDIESGFFDIQDELCCLTPPI